jgi:hypothetical protein
VALSPCVMLHLSIVENLQKTTIRCPRRNNWWCTNSQSIRFVQVTFTGVHAREPSFSLSAWPICVRTSAGFKFSVGLACKPILWRRVVHCTGARFYPHTLFIHYAREKIIAGSLQLLVSVPRVNCGESNDLVAMKGHVRLASVEKESEQKQY